MRSDPPHVPRPVPQAIEEVLAETWAILRCAADDRRSEMHTPALGTWAGDGPRLRTVVLRAVDESGRRLTCHTDARSGKVAQIDADPRVSWMFYDRQRKLQFRLSGVATVHRDDARADERWATASLASRRCYCTGLAPASTLPSAGAGLIGELEKRIPTREESERHGRPNFAVVETVVERLDWLYLAARGHRRVRLDWDGDRWNGRWVVP